MLNNTEDWNFIDTGFHTGEFNMRFDIELARKLQHGEILPTLRVYGWKPWAVSLGYNQKENDIHINKCSEFGFDIVRRPTGGRAILHANELTYSVVLPAEGKGITEVYSAISKALVSGLKKICADVNYETSQPSFEQLYRKQESIPCFSSSAKYEVQISGRKLVGSAQRRFSSPDYPEVVLQHGSILLGQEHKLLIEVLNINEEVQKKILDDIEQKTIDLSTAAGRSVTLEETANAIKAGFQKALNVSFTTPIEAAV